LISTFVFARIGVVMAEETTTTLMETARRYLASLPADQRVGTQPEVERFVRWCGPDRVVQQLRGQDVANYAETITGSVIDATKRADAVRALFVYAKKVGLTDTNLGSHLRLRKGTASKSAAKTATVERIEMSVIQKEALEAELESLKSQRPKILADLKRAMEDKDFRENAPLDAARAQQGYVEGRIREIETMLDRAIEVADDASATPDSVHIGSTVVLRNLASEKEVTYTLVRPGEVNPGQGRISFESPVGKALLQHRVGDEVEVAAPSGTLRFRVERVEG
jgi:transcription elongation factor GreA